MSPSERTPLTGALPPHSPPGVRFHLRTTLVFAVALLLLVGGGSEAMRSARMRAAHGAWVQQTHDVLRALDEVEGAVVTAEAAERGYLLTADPRYLERGAPAPARARAALAAARRLTRDNAAQSARLAELDAAVETKLAFVADVLRLATAGDDAGARALVGRHRGEELTTRISTLVAAARDEERRLLAQRLVDEAEAATGVQRSILLAGLGALGLLAAGLVMLRREAHARTRALAAAAATEASFRRVLETVHSAAVTLDADGRIIFANDSLCVLTGWSHAELLGADWFARCMPGAERARAAFARGMAGEPLPSFFESELVTRRGERRLMAWDNSLRRDADDIVTGLTAIGRDITHERAALATYRAEALLDDLTGLPNRRGFLAAAARDWQRAVRHGHGAVLVTLDLDGFKAINDTFGHHEGDRALRAMADVLRSALREEDAIGRLGGDEFVALVVPDGPQGDDTAIVDVECAVRERIGRQLEAANAAAREAGRPWEVHASIGTATVAVAGLTALARDGEPAEAPTLEALLQQADERLYAQKAWLRAMVERTRSA